MREFRRTVGQDYGYGGAYEPKVDVDMGLFGQVGTDIFQAMVLLKGLEWHKSDIALRKLKKMLWGLEALRVFDDKLKMALARIKDSKEATKKDLERVCHLLVLIIEFAVFLTFNRGKIFDIETW